MLKKEKSYNFTPPVGIHVLYICDLYLLPYLCGYFAVYFNPDVAERRCVYLTTVIRAIFAQAGVCKVAKGRE
jgi:hypothetical protein